ncbi:hypothetical protein [Calothrix sp. 336/3]|uniref:hypothetical protein n=1 Tax=Calothrix sp. 336/3 TaxID=1337936 RepID=UPI000A5B5DB1|nr:hypothetical protein [Calothrix sp. 336/3]
MQTTSVSLSICNDKADGTSTWCDTPFTIASLRLESPHNENSQYHQFLTDFASLLRFRLSANNFKHTSPDNHQR